MFYAEYVQIFVGLMGMTCVIRSARLTLQTDCMSHPLKDRLGSTERRIVVE